MSGGVGSSGRISSKRSETAINASNTYHGIGGENQVAKKQIPRDTWKNVFHSLGRGYLRLKCIFFSSFIDMNTSLSSLSKPIILLSWSAQFDHPIALFVYEKLEFPTSFFKKTLQLNEIVDIHLTEQCLLNYEAERLTPLISLG